MANYKSMYNKLFNTITDTIHILQKAQIDTEEMYIAQEDPEFTLLGQPDEEE